ncbi:MAG: hypothetical protein RLZZ393_1139, partial [Pseudomonadota bacterium]
MSAALTDLLAVYASRANAVLPPHWLDGVPRDLSLDDPGALERIAHSLGWSLRALEGRPRTQHFPSLVFLPGRGWLLAEGLVGDSGIQVAASAGVERIEWSDDLLFMQVDFPGMSRLEGAKRAIDVFWAAILRRKSMLLEATVATVAINLIALGTSIYSMQVYD